VGQVCGRPLGGMSTSQVGNLRHRTFPLELRSSYQSVKVVTASPSLK
jgi:hypothetical protein